MHVPSRQSLTLLECYQRPLNDVLNTLIWAQWACNVWPVLKQLFFTVSIVNDRPIYIFFIFHFTIFSRIAELGMERRRTRSSATAVNSTPPLPSLFKARMLTSCDHTKTLFRARRQEKRGLERNPRCTGIEYPQQQHAEGIWWSRNTLQFSKSDLRYQGH